MPAELAYVTKKKWQLLGTRTRNFRGPLLVSGVPRSWGQGSLCDAKSQVQENASMALELGTELFRKGRGEDFSSQSRGKLGQQKGPSANYMDANMGVVGSEVGVGQ